jgi:hypothetical protein
MSTMPSIRQTKGECDHVKCLRIIVAAKLPKNHTRCCTPCARTWVMSLFMLSNSSLLRQPTLAFHWGRFGVTTGGLANGL